MAETVIRNLEDLDRAAKEFMGKIGNNRIIAFYGSMGAGKTTFITAFCKALGVKDVVNSPTFTIVNEYRTDKGRSVYHFDFYRINKISEAQDIGFEEYLYDTDGICVIEWPEIVEELLPDETLRVHIAVNPDESRTLKF
ncbi:MAG: tRNA (adenosine(37)-N6)-threonylcarbamoyltransferase complex ATPase subunit type 1 TsaE [Bacteroidales bacterium]|jgi:tRNA threonylcarbamoyladenosine biosynthesis protein TsaE|nr:tRNA (adenosine(37)-N6)-threonylcarbamoyltransferase complex ATPase subunit type 1 TsaE [Bacteroidales bacterium]MCI2121569.1 tRNA (adenosine(37)-N6)-threonylcarbamoyltransferase complex ATPase subunit type 1 TsaE [Bacteroidales bacterium]MCI2145082.1 tRNA (adenosine(37)-N6)-threonylcarbamoyltransferase complex ATPase subunit type 1 TsaE [Bacteroidales bacterium]